MNQIVRDELQEVSIARRNTGIFPVFRYLVAVRRPVYFRIHPPRQAVHQSAQFRLQRRRFQRIDSKRAEPLRRSWCMQEMPKARSRGRLHSIARFSSRTLESESVSDFLYRHRQYPARWCEQDIADRDVKLS